MLKYCHENTTLVQKKITCYIKHAHTTIGFQTMSSFPECILSKPLLMNDIFEALFNSVITLLILLTLVIFHLMTLIKSHIKIIVFVFN